MSDQPDTNVSTADVLKLVEETLRQKQQSQLKNSEQSKVNSSAFRRKVL